MNNKRMEEKLQEGEAIDLSECKREDGAYVLKEFIEDKDYCDKKAEEWIWSIGRRLSDGKILAATDGRFYQNSKYECLWLR